MKQLSTASYQLFSGYLTDPGSLSQTSPVSYAGQFRRNLRDSNWFHWGEGMVLVGKKSIAFEGRLAPLGSLGSWRCEFLTHPRLHNSQESSAVPSDFRYLSALSLSAAIWI